MDLDLSYPALSKLAGDNGLSLSAMAATVPEHNGYVTLADCCQLASSDAPRWSIDCYHYLATLDRFSELLQNDVQARKSVWKKIYHQKDNSFLDTIAEAAWVIHFDSIGAKYEAEAPFANDQNSKNADIKLLSTPKGDIWLDVVNIELHPLSETTAPELVSLNSEIAQKNLLLKLHKRAIKKYDKKFKDAIKSGLLFNANVGILMCVIKSEGAVIRPFMHEIIDGIPVQIPHDLFSASPPGLNAVQVFRLMPKDKHEYLEPRESLIKSRTISIHNVGAKNEQTELHDETDDALHRRI